jgi:hypothetical protein
MPDMAIELAAPRAQMIRDYMAVMHPDLEGQDKRN